MLDLVERQLIIREIRYLCEMKSKLDGFIEIDSSLIDEHIILLLDALYTKG
ncbi:MULTISPECIES: hypothetical protein [Cytobacillus]|uniref:hypothetical protein n=1 Tax=Cytobacillus TaxID=2675230 RepID=UPI0012FE15E3|nr:hypothetical protein [Cytobacillus kochii]